MIKLYGLIVILLLLRLVPGIVGWLLCWAKTSIAMVGRVRNNFVFLFLMSARGSKF
jgi:hypothetical protein